MFGIVVDWLVYGMVGLFFVGLVFVGLLGGLCELVVD